MTITSFQVYNASSHINFAISYGLWAEVGVGDPLMGDQVPADRWNRRLRLALSLE
jgi:hypothetical protein